LVDPARSGRSIAEHSEETLGIKVSPSSINAIRHKTHFRFLPKVHRTKLTGPQIGDRLGFSQLMICRACFWGLERFANRLQRRESFLQGQRYEMGLAPTWRLPPRHILRHCQVPSIDNGLGRDWSRIQVKVDVHR
jgi:hypothetical protein